jgi:Tfp pilus assembly protein PilO
MNLNPRQRLLAILAIVAVGLFMADKIVITPLTNSWKLRAVRLAKLKEQVREGEALLKRDAALTEQRERIRKNVLHPAKSEAEGQMLKAFESWSAKAGVAVSSIRPQWKESEDDYKTLQCRADVAGSLAGLTRFLYQIEHEALGVKVDAMEIQSRDSEGSQLALVVQVSGLLLNAPKPGGRP